MLSSPPYQTTMKNPKDTCPYCGGILPGYVGVEGEWPCECEKDVWLDMKLDEYMMKKKGVTP